MEKPLFKHAGVYVTAILALGICVGGYYVTNQRQYQERVAYASEAGSQAKNEIQEFAQQTEELYQEDEPELLDEKASVSEVSSLQSEVNRIQVSAEDFQIEEDSMPEDLEEVAAEKKNLSHRLTEASDKLYMQEKIDGLYTEEVPDWQEYKEDVIADEDLQEEDIEEVNDNLGFFEDDQWLELAQSYTTEASEQLQNMADIQEKLTTYEEEEVSYEQYASLATQIEEVRNPEQQEKFEKAADDLGDRFGVSTEAAAAESPTASVAVEDETIVDGQGEEQGAQVEQENTEAY
ncbi:MAG: hypothetical protein L0L46_08550 [Tetragenococcus halophilus]|nr:hypothetical protein [Tetragenococcus halophilus]